MAGERLRKERGRGVLCAAPAGSFGKMCQSPFLGKAREKAAKRKRAFLKFGPQKPRAETQDPSLKSRSLDCGRRSESRQQFRPKNPITPAKIAGRTFPTPEKPQNRRVKPEGKNRQPAKKPGKPGFMLTLWHSLVVLQIIFDGCHAPRLRGHDSGISR
jgi:hypothetical protein